MHIAWDIGAAALTEALSERLEVPAVLANFSRLVVDPNRGLDDPTLITALSDGTLVPGNRNLARDEREARIAQYYAPYHAAIDQALARAKRMVAAPVIFSIHSFTPRWRGVMRPWHLGILWNKDDRVVRPLLKRLRAEGAFVVGDNEPYSGELSKATPWTATARRRGSPTRSSRCARTSWPRRPMWQAWRSVWHPSCARPSPMRDSPRAHPARSREHEHDRSET